MSTLNDLMMRWLGDHWRTSVTGTASAILGLTTTIGLISVAIAPDSKLALILTGASGVLTFLARVLTALATADAKADSTDEGAKP